MSNLSPEFQDIFIPTLYKGLNLADSQSSIDPQEAVLLQNLCFGDSNSVEIINGFTATATITTATGSGILGLHRYNDSTERFLLIAYNGSIYDNYGVTTGTPTVVASGLNSTGWMDFEQYSYQVHCNNGVDSQRVYRRTVWGNGLKVRTAGLPAPIVSTATIATATATATATTSMSLPEGVYKLLYTLEMNDGRIVEGNSGDGHTITITGAGTAYGSIQISATAAGVDPEGNADWLNVYATDVGGSVYYYLTGISLTAAATGAYDFSDYGDLTISEDNELAYDNYRPPIATVSRFWNGYQWFAGTSNETFLYASKFGRYEQVPANCSITRAAGDPVSSSYVIDCEDAIVEIRVASNGQLLVLCKNSLHIISGYDPTSWQRTTISKSIGCASKRSVASDRDGSIYWVGWDDVFYYGYDPQTGSHRPQRIGRKIWPKLKALNEANMLKVNGGFYKYQYYVAYPDSNASTYPDRVLEFDTRYGAWTGPHRDNYGETFNKTGGTITNAGRLEWNCFCATRLEGKTLGFFGSARSGVVYLWDSGNSFNGDTTNFIVFDYKSGHHSIGAPFLTKRFDTFGIELAPCYCTPKAHLITDYTTTESIDLVTSRSGAVYGTDLYGTGVYGSASYEYKKYRLSQACQGDTVQIRVFGTSASSSGTAETNLAIRNIGLAFSVMRRFRG